MAVAAALGKIKTGAGWQKFFAFSLEEEAEQDELWNMLCKFDWVSEEPKYRMIAKMPEFQVIHKRLAAYVDLQSYQPPQSERQSIEELPTPQPGKEF